MKHKLKKKPIVFNAKDVQISVNYDKKWEFNPTKVAAYIPVSYGAELEMTNVNMDLLMAMMIGAMK